MPVSDLSMDLYSIYYSVSLNIMLVRFILVFIVYVYSYSLLFINSSSCCTVLYSMIIQLFKNSVDYQWSFGAVRFGLFPFGAVIYSASVNIRVPVS